MGKRIYRDPTAEQAAKYRQIRELIAAEIPEISEKAKAARRRSRRGLGDAIRLLKEERELRGLSLADISNKTGLSKSAISKLENNQDANPTVNTLSRYAASLGMTFSLILTDEE